MDTARTVLTRAALAPLLVRGGILLAALLAYAVAYPPQILVNRGAFLLVLVAALPAVAPRGAWPTLAVLVAVAGWVLATTGYGTPVALWRLLVVATLLYLLHTLAALAATLPYDVVLVPEAITRWLARAVVVVLAAAVLVVLMLAAAGRSGGQTLLVAALAGLAVAVGVASLLAWLLRR